MNLRLHGLNELDDQLHLTRDQPSERGRRRAIRHVLDVETGKLFHIFGGEMLRGANAGAAEIELARIGLGLRDDLLEVLGRKARRRYQNEARRSDHRHHLEVGDRIVAQGLVDRRRDRVCIAHHQRGVAILGRARDRFGGGGAAGADAIFDHHRLAKQLGERLRHDARWDIGAAAGAEADYDPDRLLRPVLCKEK